MFCHHICRRSCLALELNLLELVRELVAGRRKT